MSKIRFIIFFSYIIDKWLYQIPYHTDWNLDLFLSSLVTFNYLIHSVNLIYSISVEILPSFHSDNGFSLPPVCFAESSKNHLPETRIFYCHFIIYVFSICNYLTIGCRIKHTLYSFTTAYDILFPFISLLL